VGQDIDRHKPSAVEQIAGRLKKLRMAQYAQALADNDIDLSVLRI
jgi:hypothetical protein